MTKPTPLRVLIVEDEQRLRDVLTRGIESLGCEALGAGSGEEALKLIDRHEPPIAILDLNLPGMSGMDLFARIREHKPDTHVIILTGFGDLDAARQAIRLDVVDFLTKPCHLGDLEVALSRARQRMMLVEPPPIDPPDDPPAAETSTDIDYPAKLADIERRTILDALARHDGNRKTTAEELGISVRTLYYRLKEYQDRGLLD